MKLKTIIQNKAIKTIDYIVLKSKYLQSVILYAHLMSRFRTNLQDLCKYCAGYFYVFHNIHDNEWSWKDFEIKIRFTLHNLYIDSICVY